LATEERRARGAGKVNGARMKNVKTRKNLYRRIHALSEENLQSLALYLDELESGEAHEPAVLGRSYCGDNTNGPGNPGPFVCPCIYAGREDAAFTSRVPPHLTLGPSRKGTMLMGPPPQSGPLRSGPPRTPCPRRSGQSYRPPRRSGSRHNTPI